MALVNQPAILSGAFAAEGDKNTIPANNDGLSGLASIAKGFPPITQVPLAQGGQPPQRQDFNGIFNLFSQFLLYAQNGGVYAYNNTLDYQPPCIISYDGEFYSCVAENGPGTSAGVQPVTNTTYWAKLVPDIAIMKGASSSAAGAAGLVPAPPAGIANRYLRSDGFWQVPPDTKYSNMKGATVSAAGASGLVPAPAQNQQNYFLTGGGIWRAVATTQQAEAGTDDTAPMTALKVKQAIDASTNGGIPIGHEWWTSNPNIPTGCLPLFGGTYSREAYKDLWAWVQTQTGYLITEAEWQEKATANDGNVPFYSDGDGSTTFRVPSLSCWVRGANGVEEVGSYLEAGLPNITGSIAGISETFAGFGSSASNSAIYKSADTPSSDSTPSRADTNNAGTLDFNASRSNSIYGASDTVQPPSIVGMYLVKAFGTVSNVGNQDIADISAGLTRVENQMTKYTDEVAYIDSFVVETWRSDDGSSWYRKYSDGWLEQGGTFGSGTSGTIMFPKAFSTEVYLTFGVDCEATDREKTAFVYTESLTGFTWEITDRSRGYWRASGY